MHVWRICRERYASAALSGEGARFAGGRWNSLGVPMVYTATSLALAALEVFVHVVADEEPDDLVSVCAEIPFGRSALLAAEQRTLQQLDPNWRFEDVTGTRAFGDAWIAAKSSLALPVPSVVIEGDWNLLLNPAHPDAGKIRVVESKAFRFDSRMFGTKRSRY